MAAPLAKLVPRNVWDITDDALDLYRARFFPFCGLAALFLGVPLIFYIYWLSGPLRAILQSAMAASSGGNTAPPDAAIWNFTAAALLATPLFWMGRGIMDGPIAAVVGEYLTTGEYISVGEATRRALRHWWPLLATSALAALAVTFSSLVFSLLILALLPLTAFLGAAVVWEGRGTMAAFKRSFSLNRGFFGKGLGLILLVQTIGGFFILTFVLMLVLIFTMIPLRAEEAVGVSQRFIIGFSLMMAVSVALMPLEAIARTLLYFDIRVRREGLDVVSQAIEQDYPLMDDPFGDMTSEEARQRQRKATRR